LRFGLGLRKREELTSRDTLDTATASETTNGRLGDTLNVVAQNLAMAFGTTLSETFASFTTWRMLAVFGDLVYYFFL
jgi:hypothetical protein